MAATPVEIIHGVSGLSGTLKLYPRGSDSIANGAGDAFTEQTNRKGVYRATVDEALTGLHEAYLVDGGGNVLFAGVIDLVDSTAVQTVAELAHAITPSLAGIGARTVSVTVDDGTDPIEGATVRLSKGAESYTQRTDSDGECFFNLDDGTWLVAITMAGYSFAGDTLEVDADEAATFSMTPYSITPPASPNLTSGFVLCLGIDGLPEAGVKIYAQLTAGPGDDGYALDTDTITMTSDEDGLAQHAGFVCGGTYRFRRGTSGIWTDAQTAPATATWNLAEILGDP